ncbi:MAG: RecQ family ATP-dependent DNA helicase [Ignavibacteriaceae bacterium]|jgi:ATP-dependent DNA helicase RecQ|nr:RecQ family ATP-dependent DNA helicase [Ignavibacteriaceae bacterium]MCW8817868.1 RecQ family ATP-dependent DNA helicase [Ignavibacteriaceae bacterium]MCW9095335.1 RecQ family ATP-dependent DNA helicase [Ignavibacteriaceae bacterium]
MDKQEATFLLRKVLNNANAEFREGQWEAIDSVANKNKKLLLVQRTGWGKSIVYFLSTKILRDKGIGITLIISPLLALMRNQLEAAKPIGINAETINSANTNEWKEVIRKIRSDTVDALLISPERLANENFIEEVIIPLSDKIGLFVVDEAHCISDWGHDFRPDYRRIINVLRNVPANMPVLATTATANDRVVKDIELQLKGLEIRRGNLSRKSLYLQNIVLPDQAQRLAWLAENLPKLTGTGIIYTLTKRDAETVAGWLKMNNIKAEAYYSDVENEDFNDANEYRIALEEKLLNNQIKALVATSALGLGYDKPDLGFVIHYQAPGNVVSYYQQVGRAGRAIDKAYGILLTGREDEEIHEFFRRKAFPHEQDVYKILDLLNQSDGLTVRNIEEKLNFSFGSIEKVLKLLSVENPAPVIKDKSKYYRTPNPFKVDRDRISFLTNQRISEWEEMQVYVNHKECLMKFLRKSLDDPDPSDCNNCQNCKSEIKLPVTINNNLVIAATRFIKQSEMPLVLKKQVAKDSFPIYGLTGSTPAKLRGENGRILARWGDAGWGYKVRECKNNNHLSDDLVNALAEMITERWKPQPKTEWVTCVPSLNHTELVPDFASRLALKLGIPFKNVVKKIKNNSQQKFMQNRFHQCNNLDGVFEIDGVIENSPVLLFDDIVDSGWTLTVISALLRKAGSGIVYPVVLASTTSGS